MTQIATTIEQSKRLLELGIDIKTSDMYYSFSDGTFEGNLKVISNGMRKVWDINLEFALKKQAVPAWSLSALMGFIEENCNETFILSTESKGWYTSLIYSKYAHIINGDKPFDIVYGLVECILIDKKNER